MMFSIVVKHESFTKHLGSQCAAFFFSKVAVIVALQRERCRTCKKIDQGGKRALFSKWATVAAIARGR
jgi:hypothetical protein